MQFGFQNSRLLVLLEKRAIALRSANFEKADQIEEEMTKYKNENFEKVTTPITAYCTFKYDHAFLKILEKYDSHSPYEVDHIKYQG